MNEEVEKALAEELGCAARKFFEEAGDLTAIDQTPYVFNDEQLTAIFQFAEEFAESERIARLAAERERDQYKLNTLAPQRT